MFRKEALPRKFVVLKIIKSVPLIVLTSSVLFFLTVYPFIGGPSVSRTIPAVVGTMILVVPFIPFVVWGLFESLKQKKIKREGQVLLGELLEIKAQVKGSSGKGPGPRFVVSVRYGFTSPEREYIIAKASQVRDDLIGKSLAPAGTRVGVLYLNRRSFLLL